jgi:hypothetical protein
MARRHPPEHCLRSLEEAVFPAPYQSHMCPPSLPHMQVASAFEKLGGIPQPAFIVPSPPTAQPPSARSPAVLPLPRKRHHPDSQAPPPPPQRLAGSSPAAPAAMPVRGGSNGRSPQQRQAAGAQRGGAAQQERQAEQAQHELRQKAEMQVLHACTFGFEHMEAPKVRREGRAFPNMVDGAPPPLLSTLRGMCHLKGKQGRRVRVGCCKLNLHGDFGQLLLCVYLPAQPLSLPAVSKSNVSS